MKEDDRVKCIDDQGTDRKLRAGETYTIESIDHYTGYVFLKEIPGAWSVDRFVQAGRGFSLGIVI